MKITSNIIQNVNVKKIDIILYKIINLDYILSVYLNIDQHEAMIMSCMAFPEREKAFIELCQRIDDHLDVLSVERFIHFHSMQFNIGRLTIFHDS